MPTPENFLIRLKEHFKFEPIIEGAERSEEFSEFNKKEFETFENSIKEKLLNYSREDDYLVLSLVEEVLPILTSDEKQMIKRCAFGKLLNTKMNAFCAISKDGLDNYCIILNEGLLMLLHKYGKLLIAQKHDNSVVFCNRGNVDSIKKEDYSIFLIELINNYKKYKAPVGAMLKLHEDYLYQHGTNIHFQELFILCHELGHLFNKDLEQSQNLMNLIEDEASVINENKFHDIEYKADLYAFDLLTRVAKNKYKLDKKHIIYFVIMLFDIMGSINPLEGEKHPSAINRMLNILENFWSEKVASQYLKTYSDELSVEDFFETL